MKNEERQREKETIAAAAAAATAASTSGASTASIPSESISVPTPSVPELSSHRSVELLSSASLQGLAGSGAVPPPLPAWQQDVEASRPCGGERFLLLHDRSVPASQSLGVLSHNVM